MHLASDHRPQQAWCCCCCASLITRASLKRQAGSHISLWTGKRGIVRLVIDHSLATWLLTYLPSLLAGHRGNGAGWVHKEGLAPKRQKHNRLILLVPRSKEKLRDAHSLGFILHTCPRQVRKEEKNARPTLDESLRGSSTLYRPYRPFPRGPLRQPCCSSTETRLQRNQLIFTYCMYLLGVIASCKACEH